MRLTTYLRQAFVLAAMNDVPQVNYQEQIQKLLQEDAMAKLPPKIRAVYDDKSLRGYLASQYISAFHVYLYGPISYTVSPEIHAKAHALKELANAQQTHWHKLKGKLNAVADSVTTRKALVAALPEFEKYLPTTEETANRQVPAIANVISDFVKAGWPKDQKKMPATLKAEAKKEKAI
jgi:hypothetical protein